VQSKSDYQDILRRFYGFIKPLEELSESQLDSSYLPDLYARRKASALLEDIRSLGNGEKEPELSRDLPSITSPAAALGAFYVLEGSTLGGQIISQMISRKLQLADGESIRYFNGYGPETQQKWETFKHCLDSRNWQSHESDAVVEAAEATFLKFKQFIEQDGN
jgi:heme oxygenase (biliverdin-IX-beta and delta-forming)